VFCICFLILDLKENESRSTTTDEKTLLIRVLKVTLKKITFFDGKVMIWDDKEGLLIALLWNACSSIENNLNWRRNKHISQNWLHFIFLRDMRHLLSTWVTSWNGLTDEQWLIFFEGRTRRFFVTVGKMPELSHRKTQQGETFRTKQRWISKAIRVLRIGIYNCFCTICTNSKVENRWGALISFLATLH